MIHGQAIFIAVAGALNFLAHILLKLVKHEWIDRVCSGFSPEPFPEGKPAFHFYPSTATRQCKGLYFQRKIIPSRQKCRSSSKRQLLTRFPPLQSHSFPLFLGLPRNLLQGQRQMHWQLVKTNQPLEVEQPLSCLVRFWSSISARQSLPLVEKHLS